MGFSGPLIFAGGFKDVVICLSLSVLFRIVWLLPAIFEEAWNSRTALQVVPDSRIVSVCRRCMDMQIRVQIWMIVSRWATENPQRLEKLFSFCLPPSF